jgi:Uma2 family endonuclease
MSDPLEKPETHLTYDDYRQWDLAEGERYERSEGVPYAMAGPNDYHQAISGELFGRFWDFLKGKPCKVRSAPYDVRLFYDGEDDTVVQPDLVVVCDEAKRGSEGCRGAPDLVAEILSPGNTLAEMNRKLKLYMRAGVREYWLVDGEDKTVTVYLAGGGTYRLAVYSGEASAPVAILPGLEISLPEIFAG